VNWGGEVEGFDRLIEAHLDALYRYALRLCRGRAAEAEDLVQDAVLRALKSRHQLRSLEAGRAWLFQILTRTHLNRIRSRERRAETVATDLDEQGFEEALAAWSPLADPEEELLRSEQREQLLEAMDRLDPDLRAALWLSDVEEFTQREVADMLAIPEGTVASRVFRARRALRGQFGPVRRDGNWLREPA
jgi:RNA polymerase sigma-70 factor (ECF subfamily)